jgi:hypothetical protein
MKTKSTIVSVVALMSALSFALPASAQDAGAQTGTDTQTQTDAGAGTDADGGTQSGTDTSGGTQNGTDTQGGGTTTDQGGAQAGGNVDVNVTTEQQTEVRTAITEVNVQPVTNIDIDINVGVVIPQTVTLTPLPARVVTVLPQFAGYLFFLLPDGRIVIVAPTTLKVVYVLAA